MAIATYNDVASGTKTTGVTSSSGKSKSSAYTNAVASPQTYKKVYSDVGIIKNDQPKNNGGGTIVQTGSSSGGSSSGGGGGSSSGGGDNIINMIKDLLAEQQAAARNAAKARWEQADALALQDYEGTRDAYNVYKEKGERWIRNKYSPTTGQGISASIANNANWLKNLATNKQNYTNNKATNLATYNTELSNAANTMAQGYYNYVLPYYTNEAVNDRNGSFRFQ